MSVFSASMTSAGATYPATANAVIPFEPRRLILTNTDNVNKVFVRLGRGTTIADEIIVPVAGTDPSAVVIELNPVGEQVAFGAVQCEVRIRSAAGTPTITMTATT